MRRLLLSSLLATPALVAGPSLSQAVSLEIYSSCASSLSSASRASAYDTGKRLALNLNTIVNVDWKAEKLRPSILLRTKNDYLTFAVQSPKDVARSLTAEQIDKLRSCRLGERSVMVKEPWNPALQGFYEYLSPALKKAYLAAPER